ncbi:MAG: hypothetical protein KKA07_11995 [Bacteroidetes bacterium]|nr:hypothetical protein [Bacteroidota bacterium]MBU1719779.1 hypothetical protein [Bacteroidota bacterium]
MRSKHFTLGYARKLVLIFTSVMCFVAISSCKKQKSCAGFSTSDISEFTYIHSDTLTFENSASGLFQVVFTQVNFSEPYSYECKDIDRVCPCINFIEAMATDSKTVTPYSFLKMEQSDVSEMQYFKYNVQGFEYEFDFINELPYIDQMPHLAHYSSFTIGNVAYSDVILITNQDLSTADIFQVYFNKQNGVLRFIVKSTNEVWSIRN